MKLFRYSAWDGSQDIFNIQPDDIMDALAEGLFRHGDLNWAWRDILRKGLTSEDGMRSMSGLQDVLRQVEQKKKDILQKYSPDSFKIDDEQMRQLMEKVQDYFSKIQDFMERVQEKYQAQSDKIASQMEQIYQKYQQLREKLKNRMQNRPPRRRSPQLSESDMYQNLSRMLDQMNRLLEDESFLDNLLENLDFSAENLENLLNSLDNLSEQQLNDLMNYLDQIQKLEELLSKFPFSGSQMMSLGEGEQILQQLSQIEDLLKFARWGYGNVSDLDMEQIRQLLGDEVFQQLQQLREMEQMLENSGYFRSKDGKLELTPQGQRKIGAKALRDIFNAVKKDWYGKHRTPSHGKGGERNEETKFYEYGDHFDVDLSQTLKNSLFRRNQPGVPIEIHPDDFEVYKREYLTSSATVIMLDMSHSMELYDYNRFTAAKKVALALESLIRLQFPRDKLYVVGFGDEARELRVQDLPYVSVGPEHTNTQGGLELSRKLLSRHRSTNKQIILITDGKPTAATINGRRYIHTWGVHPAILEATFLEAMRCRKSGITINTFMLADDYYLIDFVRHLTKISHGRAFYTTPHRLGEYVIVDYISRKKKHIV